MHKRSGFANHRQPALLAVAAAMLLAASGARGAGEEPVSARQAFDSSGFRGGLVVYLGDDAGTLLELGDRVKGPSLVQGLSTDPAKVAAARRMLRDRGAYGPIAVDRWDGRRLPLIDNLVNVLIADSPAEVSDAELLRVLAPKGTVLLRQPGGVWRTVTKPRPPEIDDWTHYLHDATNNPVGHDQRVGPPRRMQWVGSPRWSRHHEHMSSMNALVSADGRLFYVFDEAPALSGELPAKWKLIARDAFNGVILWKRPIASWHNYRWPLKSGPAQLPRRLVAVGDTVFATLSYQGPVEALDAATGKTRRVFESTPGAEELLVDGGVLFALVNPTPVDYSHYKYDTSNAICWVEKQEVAERYPWDAKPRSVQAIDAGTGEVLWEVRSPVMPLSMAVDGRRVYFHNGRKLVAADRQTGTKLWESPDAARKTLIPTNFGATLVVYGDVVLFTGGNGKMSAYSAATGERLWEDRQPPTGHNCPLDILASGGLVWNAAIAGGKHDGIFRGRDPHTGEVVKEFPPDVDTYWFHHRCYRAKATDQYLLTSRTGVEFVSFDKQHWDINHWVRGACLYGILPANGLLYAPQHPCICYAESKLNGFCALAPDSGEVKVETKTDETGRLERGPAYESEATAPSDRNSQPSALLPPVAAGGLDTSTADPTSAWPTYRHDAARSGAASTDLPARLAEGWSADLGGRLSSVTVDGPRLYVASIDTHTVYALDAKTGKTAWTFTAGGRVDSPPTCWRGRVLFGSADGCVYCLRAADGQMIWRYRCAPRDLRMMAFEQIESVWPVHGAVLVHDGVLYATAGRSMFLDGGLRLLRLDPATGRKLSETVLDDVDPTTGESLQAKIRTLNMPVALPDILSCDGKYVYMRSQKFDLDGTRPVIRTPDDDPKLEPSHQMGDDVHLFCPTGFLDDSWFHRGYWLYGRTFSSGCDYWFRAGRFVPAGRLLVFDDQTVYGYGRKPSLFCWTPVLEYHLFAADRSPKQETARIEHVVEANREMEAKERWVIFNRFVTTAAPKEDMSAVGIEWSDGEPDLLVRAMALAGRTLLVAGPPDVVDELQVFQNPFDPENEKGVTRQAAALDGSEGGLLHAVDAQSGHRRWTLHLSAPPVWDGMAAANRCVYVATIDGRVTCLRGQ